MTELKTINIVAINLTSMIAIRGDDDVLGDIIPPFIDSEGDETNDIDEAAVVTCQWRDDGTWSEIELSAFEPEQMQ